MQQNKIIIKMTVFGAWVALLAVLYGTGHDGWGFVFVVIPLGLVLGIARTRMLNANRISVVGIHGSSGLQCPNCGGRSSVHSEQSAASSC